jgi:hypothetical protein
MMRMFPVNLVGEEGTQKLPSIIVQMKRPSYLFLLLVNDK